MIQTDTLPSCAAMSSCSGASIVGAVRSQTECAAAGPVGVTNPLMTIQANQIRAKMFMQSKLGEPGVAEWAAGNWTVRVNPSLVNNNVRLDDVYICRVNAVCGTVTTIGSLTGLNQVWNAGVKTHVVPGALDIGNASDTIYIVLVFRETSGIARNFSALLDQTIDTPIELAAPLAHVVGEVEGASHRLECVPCGVARLAQALGATAQSHDAEAEIDAAVAEAKKEGHAAHG